MEHTPLQLEVHLHKVLTHKVGLPGSAPSRHLMAITSVESRPSLRFTSRYLGTGSNGNSTLGQLLTCSVRSASSGPKIELAHSFQIHTNPSLKIYSATYRRITLYEALWVREEYVGIERYRNRWVP